MTEKP